MPKFECKWSLHGRSVVEADDVAEAEEVLGDALMDFDTMMMESVDVDVATVGDIREL